MRLRWSLLNRTLPGPAVLAVGAALIIAADIARTAARVQALQLRGEAAMLGPRREAAAQDAAEHLAMRDLKRRDVSLLKKALPMLTQSRRALYEEGLQLQEEKRLLEKQWDLMTTYLVLDQEEKRVRVMRGEEAQESYRLSVSSPVLYGLDVKPPPALTVVVSKERFAHPERGRYAEEDGKLVWNPPQVGPASRADALGEFVIFTRGSLILHGPAKVPAQHAAYPHYCLELPLATARRLYAATFIGAKILLQPPKAAPKN